MSDGVGKVSYATPKARMMRPCRHDEHSFEGEFGAPRSTCANKSSYTAVLFGLLVDWHYH